MALRPCRAISAAAPGRGDRHATVVAVPGFFAQNSQRIGDSAQGGLAEQRRAQQIPAASLEDPQTRQKISAVDGGDVARRQRLQRVGVVPVEKMSFVAFQAVRALPSSACSGSRNR